ncbi:MAG: phosphoribosylglycinamide formyltransferase [Candidatus Omnitrophica bacterium]|nr:phosphoribosylglycinamide formyltransferase [Candidatus Omnitrophota bacterium]
MLRFAVFASGEGTNLQSIIDAVQKKEIHADLVLVFSNRKKANALKRAEAAGIETLHLNRKDYASPQSYERDIVIHLKEHRIDFLVTAGYMKLFTGFFVKQYPNKIINVHPSLLPAFKGRRGIKDTFTYAAKLGGVTIHFVNEKMDNGPMIIQESIRIHENETLESFEARIHEVEHRVFPQAIQMFALGRLKIKGRKVRILDQPPRINQ